MARKLIIFKHNDKIVASQPSDLFISEIEKFKKVVAEELECHIDEIEVGTIFVDNELSDVDITPDGMTLWKNSKPQIIDGVKCTIKPKTDLYLDAMIDGTLIEYLNFSLEYPTREDDGC